MINLVILITFTLDVLMMLLGENWCWSLLGPKGLKCREKKQKLHYSGSSRKWTPAGREEISVTRAEHLWELFFYVATRGVRVRRTLTGVFPAANKYWEFQKTVCSCTVVLATLKFKHKHKILCWTKNWIMKHALAQSKLILYHLVLGLLQGLVRISFQQS